MNLDNGDLFVVTRGYEYGGDSIGSFAYAIFSGCEPAPAQPSKPKYDRSDEGKVFEAVEVCGKHVAARCLYAPGYKRECIGRIEPLNLAEIEVMTVTKAFAEALTQQTPVAARS